MQGSGSSFLATVLAGVFFVGLILGGAMGYCLGVSDAEGINPRTFKAYQAIQAKGVSVTLTDQGTLWIWNPQLGRSTQLSDEDIRKFTTNP